MVHLTNAKDGKLH